MCLVLDRPKWRTFHLAVLNFMHHVSAQIRRSLMVCCKLSKSPGPDATLPNFVSSANFSIIVILRVKLSMSFIKITNNRGPRTEPCGAPLITLLQDEHVPFKTVLCFLSVSHDSCPFEQVSAYS